MARESIYLEPSVISYYAAKPSRDLIVAAHQQITWEWWDHSLDRYEVFVSLLTMDEIGRGDPDAAAARLELVKSFELLDITPRIEKLAKAYMREFDIPGRWVHRHRRSVRPRNFTRSKLMWKDPIVEELHAIREEIAKEHDYDLHKLIQSLQERQKQSKRRIVSRDRDRKEPTPR